SAVSFAILLPPVGEGPEPRALHLLLPLAGEGYEDLAPQGLSRSWMRAPSPSPLEQVRRVLQPALPRDLRWRLALGVARGSVGADREQHLDHRGRSVLVVRQREQRRRAARPRRVRHASAGCSASTARRRSAHPAQARSCGSRLSGAISSITARFFQNTPWPSG